MGLIEFINKKEHQFISNELIRAKKQEEICSFNTFTISSYNTHYENFHSDIIAKILDPDSSHNANNLYLDCFIEYINFSFNFNLNKEDYQNSVVDRENGNIDVGIWNDESKKVIIIENKINDAPDMDQQLLRYYKYAIAKGFDVELIIYLTLDGLKIAPLFSEIKSPVINISAYNNTALDMATGWLRMCIRKTENKNAKSFLNEYYKLLQFLSSKSMENNAFEQFYNLLNNDNGFNIVENIVSLRNDIPKYRTDKLVDRIGNNYYPFKNAYRYKPYYQLYTNFNENESNFKIDVQFFVNGDASIVFWDSNEENRNEKGRELVTKKLISIGMISDFEDEISYGYNGYIKRFELNKNKNLEEIDNLVYSFLTRLFSQLKHKPENE